MLRAVAAVKPAGLTIAEIKLYLLNRLSPPTKRFAIHARRPPANQAAHSRHFHAQRRAALARRLDPRGGTAPLCRLADREGRPRALSQRIDRRVHPFYARRAAADREDRVRAGGRAGARVGRGRRGQRPRDAGRLRALCRVRCPGRGHRLAVLLQAVSRVGLRLFSRDRPATAPST